MKTLATHINEALKIGKDISSFSTYSYQPKTREELKEIIANKIANEGTRCNLNDIDVSQVESMGYLFYKSKFNRDISKWNIRQDCSTDFMFDNCPIKEEYKPKLPR